MTTKTPKKNNENIIKAWVVVWSKESAGIYPGIKPFDILSIEVMPDFSDEERLKVRCKCHAKKGKKTGWHYLDSMAIFTKKSEAECWNKENNDFKIFPCEIKIKLKL